MPACTTQRWMPHLTRQCQGWEPRKFILRFVTPGTLGVPVLLIVCLLGGGTSLHADADSQPAEAALRRMAPGLYSQLSLRITPSKDGGDYFRISGEARSYQG